MQTSGMAPQFSDGVKKQVTQPAKVAKLPGKLPMTPAPQGPKNTHMRGGAAKHAKGSR
jgi:hypothetical protein